MGSYCPHPDKTYKRGRFIMEDTSGLLSNMEHDGQLLNPPNPHNSDMDTYYPPPRLRIRETSPTFPRQLAEYTVPPRRNSQQNMVWEVESHDEEDSPRSVSSFTEGNEEDPPRPLSSITEECKEEINNKMDDLEENLKRVLGADNPPDIRLIMSQVEHDSREGWISKETTEETDEKSGTMAPFLRATIPLEEVKEFTTVNGANSKQKGDLKERLGKACGTLFGRMGCHGEWSEEPLHESKIFWSMGMMVSLPRPGKETLNFEYSPHRIIEPRSIRYVDDKTGKLVTEKQWVSTWYTRNCEGCEDRRCPHRPRRRVRRARRSSGRRH
ncbi:hypothetical protein F4779DRAFT_81411 [Xylariaceae sp. FL0662B]|nr:hypothetical protein F4779DRAFT_81411 [Xylariaceae sp. FL0662B]